MQTTEQTEQLNLMPVAPAEKKKRKPRKKKETPVEVLPPLSEEELALRRLQREDENRLVARQVNNTNTYSLDTETKRWESRNEYFEVPMIGLSVSANGHDAAYLEDRDKWSSLAPREGQRVVMHNAKFDIRILEENGIKIDKFEDTKIAAHLINENLFKYNLKFLAEKYLGVKNPILYDEASDGGKITDPEKFAEYAKNDTRYTLRLWEKLEPGLKDQNLHRVYNLEKDLVRVLIEAESIGMRVDASRIEGLRALTGAETRKAEELVFDQAGRAFNVDSPKQLAEVLYDDLGLPCYVYSKKTGERSTGKEALSYLDHPIIEHLSAHRQYSKLDSAFLKSLPKFIDSNGRIHPSFNAQGARTGRMSCSEPNAQQIPSRSELGKEIRKAFIPAEGHSLVVADYGAMELRVFASYLIKTIGDYSLAKVIEAGDPHQITADNMTKVAGREVLRAVAKMINFGIVYGITPEGLAARLTAQGIPVTVPEAKLFVQAYFAAYPGVQPLMSRIVNFTMDNGYIVNAYGRRRHLEGYTPREQRQAVNYVIQGTSADIVKDSMVTLYRELKREAWDAHIIAQIHDELIIEVPDDYAQKCKVLVEEVMMQNNAKLAVPMIVDAAIGKNWAECKH